MNATLIIVAWVILFIAWLIVLTAALSLRQQRDEWRKIADYRAALVLSGGSLPKGWLGAVEEDGTLTIDKTPTGPA